MDRTIRFTRRTLRCAALACPLALLSPWLAAAAQLLWTAHAALFLPFTAPLWSHRQDSPMHSLQRAALPCCGALFLSALPRLALMLLFHDMHLLTQLLMHALTALTSVLLQCYLVFQLPHYRKAHGFLALACLLLFIVCTQSGG